MIVINDIVRSILEGMNFTLTVESFVNGAGTTTITVSEAYHAREKMTLTVDLFDYEIASVNGNDITINEVVSPSVVVLQSPYYFDGTPRMVNNELALIQDYKQKTPFLYYLENVSERWNNDVDLSVLVEADVRLFFLDNANWKDWLSDDYYSYVINRLRNLAEYFIDTLNNTTYIGEFDNYTIINHTKFGEYRNLEGSIQSVFDENLSGVELRINLPILKNLNCEAY